ncbi:MAG: hypothetical protein AAB955_03990 [Patescibacteria group bacterium]
MGTAAYAEEAAPAPPTEQPEVASEPEAPLAEEVVATEEVIEVEEAVEAQEEAEEAQVPAATFVEEPEVQQVEIQSGDAVATANILNIVNTNSINSEGSIILGNLIGSVGDIDLRTAATGTPQCAVLMCSAGIETYLISEASIQSMIRLQALTGGNTLDGNGSIDTGNAFAGLNLVNIANTNFVDSNYLIVSLNAFQNVTGDIVFPSIASFFGGLRPGVSGDISVQSAASVDTLISAETESGGNESNGDITTGDSYSEVNVVNQLNSLLIGGGSVALIFRVHGEWAGDIFGAPTDLTNQGSGYYLFAADTTGTASGTSVTASSSASIMNDAELIARSGENVATGDTSSIQTGSAYAGANIVNIANAHIIGRNWILAIINIFGDFTGNISFGRPDLWVGGQVTVSGVAEPGSPASYKLTLINRGDAPASNVVLHARYDSNMQQIDSSSLPYTMSQEGLAWELGTIPPGGAVEVTYQTHLGTVVGSMDVVTVAEAVLRETDNNYSDNRETISFRTAQVSHPVGWIIPSATVPAPAILGASQSRINKDTTKLFTVEVIRLTPDAVVHEGNTIAPQAVVLRNITGRLLFDVVVHDLLYAPNGALVRDEVWDLGDVEEGEQITIEYDIHFEDGAPEGIYVLSTEVGGEGGSLIGFPRNGSIAAAFPIPVSEETETTLAPIVAAKITREIVPAARVRAIQIAEASGGALPATRSVDPTMSLVIELTTLLLVARGYYWWMAIPRR